MGSFVIQGLLCCISGVLAMAHAAAASTGMIETNISGILASDVGLRVWSAFRRVSRSGSIA